MGSDQAIAGSKKRMVGRGRLYAKDIKAGPCEAPDVEGCGKIDFVD